MAATETDFNELHEEDNTIAYNSPRWTRILQDLRTVWRALIGISSSNVMYGLIFGDDAGNQSEWKVEWITGGHLALYERTGGTPASPVWTERDRATAGTGFQFDAARITSGTFADGRISQSSVTQHEAALDHNSLLNSAGSRHVDHAALSLIAGTDIAASGLGTLDANRTINHDVSGVSGSSVLAGRQPQTISYNARGHITSVDAAGYTRVTSTDSTTGHSGLTALGTLTAVAIPGADGVKNYKVRAMIQWSPNSNNTYTSVNGRIYVGPNGTSADPLTLASGGGGSTDSGYHNTAYIEGVILAPGIGDKVGVYLNSVNGYDFVGSATRMHWLEITEDS